MATVTFGISKPCVLLVSPVGWQGWLTLFLGEAVFILVGSLSCVLVLLRSGKLEVYTGSLKPNLLLSIEYETFKVNLFSSIRLTVTLAGRFPITWLCTVVCELSNLNHQDDGFCISLRGNDT